MEWLEGWMRLDIVIKLGVSAILGLAIGLERELKRKPVGLKTSLVISIVSCLLTIISIETTYIVPSRPDVNVTMDPLRLAAQIVSGIGFLGAGVILRRNNDSILGLTTAAMIWGAAGIGITVGAGFYFAAIAGVIFILLSVELVPFLLGLIGPKQLREKEILLKVIVVRQSAIHDVMEKIEALGMNIDSLRIKDLPDHQHLIQLRLSVDYRQQTADVYEMAVNLESVTSVEVESI
ncbi:putative Mg2+ transporter-C (MgtC) family protein [Bacillus oleivorans]|uniref:Putative Mg2+ transporter-C (MgtC) family protein n=2 Tax=Bacillus oleivorans TaxID=1448271 RepID=A0A285CUK4_9BACI|nr:MgtC/SapB family protein [Bacillus oleivorans]SNX71204.1 putative Mg2+ transporter-C (MgtC) family protein [Bacillus oleivorans]